MSIKEIFYIFLFICGTINGNGENMKKITVYIALSILIIGLFLFLQHFFAIKSANVKVILKENTTIECHTKVKVSDFIEEINGTILDDYNIDTSYIGELSVPFYFVNTDGIKVFYQFTITVVDTISPIVWMGNSYTVLKDSDPFFYQKILCGDNYDDLPTCYIEGNYDTTKVGTYPLVFKAIDSSGNATQKEFSLHVIESKKGTSSSQPNYTYFEDIKGKYKKANTKIGLDISSWQEEVDFEKIKQAGVEFVILKIGGTKKATGEYYLDSQFLRNITEAHKYGIEVGIYFFSYAKTKEEAISDAQWVIDKLKGNPITLPVAFDWEDWENYNDYHLSFYHLTEIASSFLDTIKEAGYDGMLYSSKSYLEEIWLSLDFPVWLAHYTENTNYQGDYIIWQLCSNGKIDGINTNVDINVMYSK